MPSTFPVPKPSKTTDLLVSDNTNSREEDTKDDNMSFSESTNSEQSKAENSISDASKSSHPTTIDGDFIDQYVNKKNHRLDYAKMFVLVLLCVLAGVAGWLWWRSAKENEETQYIIEFNRYSEKIAQTFLERLEFRASAATSLAVSLSTQAVGAGLQWPFVSYPDFERRTSSSRNLASATSIWFSPLVRPWQRAAWEDYATQNQYYLQNNFTDPLYEMASDDMFPYRFRDGPVDNGMFRFEEDGPVAQEDIEPIDTYSPIWQSAPTKVTSPFAYGIAMYNEASEDFRAKVIDTLRTIRSPVLSATQLEGTSNSLVTGSDYDLSTPEGSPVSGGYADGPHVFLYAPIFDELLVENASFVGSLTMDMPWQSFWDKSIPGITAPLSLELQSTCGETYHFTLGDTMKETSYLPEGPPSFDSRLDLVLETTSFDFEDALDLEDVNSAPCLYTLKITPTSEFEKEFLTNRPYLSAIAFSAIVVVIIAVFVCYDHIIQSRQNKVIQSAKRSNAIIRSLFPAGFRTRLLDDGSIQNANKEFEKLLPENFSMMETPKLRLQSYLSPNENNTKARKCGNNIASEPIAEFFPATSIMFADLSGFTAWSSTREPAQVFTLLETLYGAMDKAARRLGVFKVETVGDCYVAATGIPDPREDHAILMAKFANTCLAQIRDLTGALESQLGPGTGDLAFRIGISSGPVTAGVLRGEKSRFQLFGDTMNTSSKMEATGKVGHVHISEETAKLLIEGGKEDWIDQKANTVTATGKGEITTYWLKTNFRKVNRTSLMPTRMQSGDKNKGSFTQNEEILTQIAEAASLVNPPSGNEEKQSRKNKMLWGSSAEAKNKIDRLVEYNAEVMMSLLKKIIARRSAVDDSISGTGNTSRGIIALDEVREVIEMPEYNQEASVKMASDYQVEIPERVRSEMRAYIHRIAGLYHYNPFHNFEHASHVALSANKLLKRIVMPDNIDYRRTGKENVIEKVLAVAKDLHEHTLGISSDAVAQFAVVFAALIHDVDHPGVPNGQLAVEEPEVAAKYRNQSIAEQRSIDIAWDILMEPQFENLRGCMFPTPQEMRHFRQLIVNCVMATDIFDKELGALRKARWQKCFHPEDVPHMAVDQVDAFNRKATIVIEHIIQASDVAHTMQHWHVYVKWNERLFREMMTAYKEGRAPKNPIDGWYKGELWFFDNYVIPLAHKLQECGVFGVSSAEYLQYATENRDEWERKGEAVCQRMMADYEALDNSSSEEE